MFLSAKMDDSLTREDPRKGGSYRSMLGEHGSTSRVRWHRCDAYGHLHNSKRLRFMESTSREAWGVLVPEMEANARDLKTAYLESLQPLRYGEEFQLRTWLLGSNGSSPCRAFEFRRGGSDRAAVRARTVSAPISRGTSARSEIPPELAKPPLSPHGEWETMEVRQTPSRPQHAGAFVKERRAAWRDVGPDKLMHKASYLDDLLECVLEASADVGRLVTRCEQQNGRRDSHWFGHRRRYWSSNG